MKRILIPGAMTCALLATTALTAPALAQSAPPPPFNQVDGNGVDLVTGDFFFSMTEGSIGSGDGELALVRNWAGPAGWTDNWSGSLYTRTTGGTARIVIEFGSYSDTFTISGGTYTSTKADGATLVGVGGGYLYTASDGTQIDFTAASDLGYPISGPVCQRGDGGTCAVPSQIRRPNGMTNTLNWDIEERCFQYDSELQCTNSGAYARFRGASNSASYSFTVSYASNTPGSGVPVSNWFIRTGAQFTNSVTTPGTLPAVAYSSPASTVTEVTDTGGQVWRLTNGSAGRLTGVRRPGASSDTTTITYTSGATTVASIAREGITTGYAWSDGEDGRHVTVTDAASHATEVVSGYDSRRITSVTDPLSRTTSFTYDENSRLARQTQPEGNSVGYTYDARGNVTEMRLREKGDSGDTGDDIVTTASYDSSCANPVTCNQPNSVTDARGYTTDFTYDSTHGGVLTVTAPAPSGSGTRPQARYSYTQANGVYRVTGVSACATGASPSCIGSSDESRTVIGYDSNANVTSVEQRSGNTSGGGALSATSTFTYDALGNRLTIDGPLSGTADTTRYRYDSARRLVGIVTPDPDGGSSLHHRASRTTYGSEGQVTKVERGTVNSQSDGDWASFSTLEEVQTEYDSHLRPLVQRLASGGTAYGVTQVSYDALGRPECVAQRMNDTQFATASLPSDACTLDTEGSYGPDRITRTYYDYAGQVSQVRTAYAVSGQEANEVTTTYTSNGRVATVTDAMGNLSTYTYDNFDRLYSLQYPSATAGAGTSNSSDWIGFGYDANGNVLQQRLRDGRVLNFDYDHLNRPYMKRTWQIYVGITAQTDYTYDLLGRMLTAANSAQTLTFTYDALGRNLTEAGPLQTVSRQYDAAGRRTQLSTTGGYQMNYTRLVTGELSTIVFTGSTLASFTYDDRGRRTSLSRIGVVTTYGYDAVDRLTSLALNYSGSTNDVTFTYGYDPAGGMVSRTSSNDGFAWAGHYAVNRNYTANGLNQYSAAGAVTPTYDSLGNLTSAGATTYSYDAENRLTGTSGGVTLSYDPLGRLYQVTSGSTNRRLLYDGEQLIAEHNSAGSPTDYYVFGPAGDEPLVHRNVGASTYGTFSADERGSVIGVANSSGAATAINAYDEYGIPGGAIAGRFGYTGQQWVPELGMYHYRARAYSPTLGRFLQTDPIGYGDGMNIYAYVGNDPMNLVDPTGLGDDEDCDPGKTWDDRSCATVTGRRWGPLQYTDDFGNSPGSGGISADTLTLGPNMARCRDAMATAQWVGEQASGQVASGGMLFNSRIELQAHTDWLHGRTRPMRLGANILPRITNFTNRGTRHVSVNRPASKPYDPPGSHRALVFFGQGFDEVDTLLGEATVIFDSTGDAVGLEDTYDMNDRPGQDLAVRVGMQIIRASRWNNCGTTGSFRIISGTGR